MFQIEQKSYKKNTKCCSWWNRELMGHMWPFRTYHGLERPIVDLYGLVWPFHGLVWKIIALIWLESSFLVVIDPNSLLNSELPSMDLYEVLLHFFLKIAKYALCIGINLTVRWLLGITTDYITPVLVFLLEICFADVSAEISCVRRPLCQPRRSFASAAATPFRCGGQPPLDWPFVLGHLMRLSRRLKYSERSFSPLRI